MNNGTVLRLSDRIPLKPFLAGIVCLLLLPSSLQAEETGGTGPMLQISFFGLSFSDSFAIFKGNQDTSWYPTNTNFRRDDHTQPDFWLLAQSGKEAELLLRGEHLRLGLTYGRADSSAGNVRDVKANSDHPAYPATYEMQYVGGKAGYGFTAGEIVLIDIGLLYLKGDLEITMGNQAMRSGYFLTKQQTISWESGGIYFLIRTAVVRKSGFIHLGIYKGNDFDAGLLGFAVDF